MATFFKNTVTKSIGKQPVEVLATTPTNRATVIGMSLTNLTNDFVYVSVYLEDDTSVSGYFLKDVVLPGNTSLRAVNQGEKLIVAPENRLLVQSNVTDSVDAIISYVEIT
jgi:hypothetical protein